MGLNSPIELKMTAAGLAAKDNADSIIFTRFLAGADGTNASTEVVNVKQVIPINNYIKRTAGETYTENGVEAIATESSLKITGYGNSTDAEENYMLNEIALMAKLSDDGEEFCFAYDYTNTDTMRVRITRSQGIQCVYEMVFSRTPNLTITTSETGVTYSDLYAHTDRSVGATPVHGLVWENNQLTINGQVFDGVSNDRIKKIVGIDLYYTMLPNPAMSLYNKVALVTTTNNIYRCQKQTVIDSGQFIINDDGWKRANGSEAEAILVIDDGLTPSANEICLTDAQNHFMEWVQLDNFESRLKYLEANSQFLQYDPLDDREYNNEWVDRMTGSGTPLSPYCIYTPKDFSMIGRTEQYGLDKVYKLMNNLDFTSAIGINVSINNEGYEITATNQQAPLYHNGEGYWPVGYDGTYPASHENTRGLTWNQVQASANFNATNDGEGYRIEPNINSGFLNYAFIGELDGNSKVIKGITCAPINTYSVGLFMFLSKNAKIHNLTIKDSCFILSNVYLNKYEGKESYIGAIAGRIIKGGLDTPFTINIYNVYNYASVINNFSSEDRYTCTAGIIGSDGDQDKIYFIIDSCANHGNLIYVSETPNHNIAGIINGFRTNDNQQEVMNCINTASFIGKNVRGIAKAHGSKVNINCGVLGSYTSVTPHYSVLTQVISDLENIAKSFANNQNYSNDNNVLQKSPEYLKSEEFITEANSYLPIPAFVYNDLGVNDGWPLLVDEYNTLTGIDGNLSLAVVDPTNKKIYKSGLPMKKFQTIPTYKEMVENTNQTVESKITQFNDSTLAGLQIVTSTISTSDWSLDTNTNKYLATKSITGISTSTPIQLLTQFTTDEITINNVSSNAVVFQCDSEPASDIKVSVMFTA